MEKNQNSFAVEKKADEKRLDGLVDRLAAASGFGKSVFDRAANQGVKVCFSDQVGLSGAFLSEEKKILLNKNLSDDKLVTTLVRASRYAVQGIEMSTEMTLSSAIRVARAKEADAKACEAVAAIEMRHSDPKAYQAFFNQNTLLVGICYYGMQETKSIDKAMDRGFRHWYEDKSAVEAVDGQVISYMMTGNGKASSYKTEISDDRLGNEICPYASVDFLRTKTVAAVCPDTADRIANIERHSRTAQIAVLKKTIKNGR